MLIMDDVKCAIFVALIMALAAEIVIEKNGMWVWYNASWSEKWAIVSELRNFLINGFSRQGWKTIRIWNNLLDSNYFLSGNQNSS